MLGAVFFLTVMDAVARILTIEIGVIPTRWTRYAGQSILDLIIIFPRVVKTVKSEHISLLVWHHDIYASKNNLKTVL